MTIKDALKYAAERVPTLGEELLGKEGGRQKPRLFDFKIVPGGTARN